MKYWVGGELKELQSNVQVLVISELAAEYGQVCKGMYWNGLETFDLGNNLMLFICKTLEKLKQRKISND